MEAAGCTCTYEEAADFLERADYHVKTALIMYLVGAISNGLIDIILGVLEVSGACG